MPDRRVDIESRGRIEQIESRYRRSTALMYTAIVGLYLCAVLGGFFLWKSYGRIQDSRFDAARDTCQEANDRHDKTVTAFRAEFERASRDLHGAARKNAEASREANIRLINVFIPVHKDRRGRSTCTAFAQERSR